MKNKVDKRKIIFVCLTMMMIAVLILLIPLDHFIHGFYCTPMALNDFGKSDYLDGVLLTDTYELEFTPRKSHFAGFEICLCNFSEESTGWINLSTYDSNGKQLDNIKIAIGKLKELQWYIVNTSGIYRKDQKYQLKLSAENCTEPPAILLVSDLRYVPTESQNDPLLIAYGYAEPTFAFSEKILILILFVAIWTGLLGELFFGGSKRRRITRYIALALGMITVLTWNYMYNSFDVENDVNFTNFQDDSDALVMSMIEAERGKTPVYTYGYGLGELVTTEGRYRDDQKPDYRNDEDWQHGYSKTQPQVIIAKNDGTEALASVGVTMRFENGMEYHVTDAEITDEYIILTLDAPEPLNYYKYGSLRDVIFFLADGSMYKSEQIYVYVSQYGLQGKVFRFLAKHMEQDNVEENLWLICTMSLALILTGITILVGRKFNGMMGFCYGFTFLLSPWIVNFSNSVYWVEFTWFLPMLIGLVCVIWIDKRKVRVCCYVSSFLAILIKSLCGYEYLSTIMMGLILFLMVDFLAALVNKEKHTGLLFQTIIKIGLAALAGFIAAITIHAALRGNGDIIQGIRLIIEKDVLRRVGGGNLNDMDPMLWESLNASVWDAYKIYFHFWTDLIAGIDANQFPMLCLLPVIIFIYDYVKKDLNIKNVIMYLVCFFTSISWLVMAKSHSYVHIHMNFVVWYFGFIQICFYIIGERVLRTIKGKQEK